MSKTWARWEAAARRLKRGWFWLALLSLPHFGVGAVMGETLFANAAARIELLRKADGEIVVIDASGTPIANAEAVIEQTRHAFLFGANLFKWGKLTDPEREAAYRARFSDLFNYATLGFYWGSYERQQGRPSHDYAMRVAQWCQQRGITVKGHPLAWNHADPVWLPDDANTIRRLQMERIEDCVGHFAGFIDSWDVVNEATHFDRGEMARVRAPRLTAMWKQSGRMAFTRECFTHAREAGRQATLLINDYRVDRAYERVIEELTTPNGEPHYDAIGIQSHMHSGSWPDNKLWDVCERFSRFGAPLHFTETTILSGQRGWNGPKGKPWSSTAEGEADQAREVARFYTTLFSHPAVEAITWWDLSDLHAWKGAPAGLVREDMTPKPAYLQLENLIKNKWWTRTTRQSDGDGRIAFRGFLGNYSVTVKAGGKIHVKDFTLSKGEKNRWIVALSE